MSDSPPLLFDTHAEAYFELEARRRTLLRDVRGLLRLFRSMMDCDRVLDVGCGTGEHAAVLSRAGIRTVGLDRSAGMIEVARARFPEPAFVRADITRFDEVRAALAESTSTSTSASERGEAGRGRDRDRQTHIFDGVFSLFGTLNYLHEAEQLAGALRVIASTLRPGGRAALEVWNPSAYRSLAGDRGGNASAPAVERVVETAGGRLHRRRSVRFETQTPDFVVIQHDYEFRPRGTDAIADGRLQTETHRLRLYSAEQMERLAISAGLRLRETRADLGGGRAGESSAGLLLVFEKEPAHVAG
ncbi:MAG: class I SAM-dependent methyltransferase [bacterium]|nr:class I SAM-dependent methyltransferase [bacterium]